MRRFVLIISLLAAPVAAAVSPEDFAVRLPVEAPAQASLLRIVLPEEVYLATRGSDLGDLRIFNAAGEAVPMARVPHETRETDREQRIELPLLALPKIDLSEDGRLVVSRASSGANVRVEIDAKQRKRPNKVVPGYLLEVKGFDVPVNELILSWPEQIAFEAAVRIRSSDDLNSWRTLVSRVPVLAVGAGETRILQDRVKLPAVRSRYIRIEWVGAIPDISFNKVILIHHERPQAEEPYQWLTLDGETKGDSIIYTSPGLFPVEKVCLVPVGETDVLPATLYSRRAVSGRWHYSGRTLGYRLRQNGGLAEGRPDRVARTHDPLWRVDLDKGARSSSLPRLQLGWMPEEVVFVARGTGPFILAVGNRTATQAWLTPAQVVPGYGTDKAASLITAQVSSGASQVSPVSRDKAPWQSGSNWLLWGVLLLGVAVLGVMARGLWRDMRSDTSDGGEGDR